MSRTGLWAVRDNNFSKLFRRSLCQAYAKTEEDYTYRSCQVGNTVPRTLTHRHARTSPCAQARTHIYRRTCKHARPRRPGSARIRKSRHMGAALRGPRLYIAIAPFVWSNKCRMRSCIDLSSSQQKNRSQPMER